LLFPFAVHGACTLNVRFEENPPAVAWTPVASATTYQVQESFDNLTNSRNYFVTGTSFRIPHRAGGDVRLSYRITALIGPNVLSVSPLADACSEVFKVTLKADPEFRALVRKSVVPIAGSTAGAFGGRFKTSLRLVSNGPEERGRIVFHPAGAVATASDPSLSYSLGAAGEAIVFDDIVAQMGRTGVGSLDIVPDADASSVLPNVEARLYNDAATGTFGTFTNAVYPIDYLEPPALTFTIPSEPFRINLGLRTLTTARAKALIYGLNGRLRDFRDLEWPADYTILGTVSQILGQSVEPGEVVTILFDGAAIPFYTLTENRTNDPALFVASRTTTADTGSHVE
jgi:hypothetical protein